MTPAGYLAFWAAVLATCSAFWAWVFWLVVL